MTGRREPVLVFRNDPGGTGLDTVVALDALELLTGCSHLPEFRIVAACESDAAADVLDHLADAYPRLRARRSAGSFDVRRSIAMGAGEELPGGARVTVVAGLSPAIEGRVREALDAGSPVVAPDTPGADTVVAAGLTGTLFPRGDSACLAAVLGAYLRNAAAAELMGQNAARIERLRGRPQRPGGERGAGDTGAPAGSWDGALRFDEMEQKRAVIERLLGQPLTGLAPIEVGKHSVFSVDAGGERYFAKFFRERFSDVSWVVPPNGFESRRPARVAWNRSLFNRGNPIAPRVIAAECEPGEPVLITEWVPATPEMEGAAGDEIVASVASRCRAYRPVDDPVVTGEYHARLDALEASSGVDALAAFDAFGARLNAPVNGGFRAFARVHPQVELHRLRQLLQDDAWPIPHALRCRALGAINLLLNEPLRRRLPTLAQTDPQVKHYFLRNGEPILCDFEHCLYAVGPLDEAYWIVNTCFMGARHPGGREAVSRLRRMVPDDEMASLGYGWVLAETLYQAITGFVTGDTTILEKANEFLADFSLQWIESRRRR
jgi:hypothetical protein